MASDSTLASPTSPNLVPGIPRVLVVSEYTALAMTFLALFGCVVALFVYTGALLWRGTVAEAPQGSGSTEDYRKLSTFLSVEASHQVAKAEQRAALAQA